MLQVCHRSDISIADYGSEEALGPLGVEYGVANLIGVGMTIDAERPTAKCCDAVKMETFLRNLAQPYVKSMM